MRLIGSMQLFSGRHLVTKTTQITMEAT